MIFMENCISIKLNDFFNLTVLKSCLLDFPEDKFWILSPKGSFFRLRFIDNFQKFLLTDFSTSTFNNIYYPAITVHFTPKELSKFLMSISSETKLLNKMDNWRPMHPSENYQTFNTNIRNISWTSL
jgi:hypothetical protein